MNERNPSPNSSRRSTNPALWVAPLLAVAIGAASIGCIDRPLAPITPCVVSAASGSFAITSVDKISMLFVVDNSRSMLGEQIKIQAQIPRLVQVLASGDPNIGRPNEGNPADLFPAVKNLRIGVTTTDMGVAGVSEGLGDGCHDNSERGDDGRLLSTGDAAQSGCQATYNNKFVQYNTADPSMVDNAAVGRVGDEVRCRASVGPNGCGFEQQFEAVLKAVTPNDSSVRFFGETTGHACPVGNPGCGAANEGFVDDDSLIALILVTDETDCSAKFDRAARLFNPNAMEYNEDLNTRCFLHGTAPSLDPEASALQPVERYIEGIAALRENKSNIVFAAISGIPEDLVDLPAAEVLAHPSMEERLVANSSGSGRGQRVDKACVDALADNPADPANWATPARRTVALVDGLNQRGIAATHQSICAANFDGALSAIIEKIAAALKGACLPRALARNAQGLVTCDVIELMPDGLSCAMIPGREADPVRSQENGRETCVVTQVTGPGDAPGWFYQQLDAGGGCGQQISYTSNANPRGGVEVNLECLQNVAAAPGVAALNAPCAEQENPTAFCEGAPESLFVGVPKLACDMADTRLCLRPCSSDAECNRDGNAVCNGTFCVNPTCN